jgi:hypothetical protein
VAGFETVAQKSFPDTIDNDFTINLLLAPWDLKFFAGVEKNVGYSAVVNDPSPNSQGSLIAEQHDMPVPREADADSWGKDSAGNPMKHSISYGGHFETFPDQAHVTYNPPLPLPFVPSNTKPYDVPVLHCEIEGERAHQVCDMLDALSYPLPGMKSFCKKNWFTKLLCKVVQWFMTPAIVPALTTAWFKGSSDNRDYMGGGSLQRGDFVAISGRWCYDAGHVGYNEIHPVRYIQLLPEGSAKPGDFDEWCQRINEVPPGGAGAGAGTGGAGAGAPGGGPGGGGPGGGGHGGGHGGGGGHGPGGGTTALTDDQQRVADEQRKPWSRWVLHPLVDGCARKEEEPQPDEPTYPIIR